MVLKYNFNIWHVLKYLNFHNSCIESTCANSKRKQKIKKQLALDPKPNLMYAGSYLQLNGQYFFVSGSSFAHRSVQMY